MSGFQHQCRLPAVWWTRLIYGRRPGNPTWVCAKCGAWWLLRPAKTYGVLFAPLVYEWRRSDAE